MTFVPAFSKSTGDRLPNPVPERWFDHPVLGANIRKSPRGQKSTGQQKAPAAGDHEKE